MLAQPNIAGLREAYLMAKDDSTRQNALLNLVNYYNEVNRDSALYYNEQRLVIAKKIGYKLLEASALSNKGYQKIQKGQYAEALECLLESLKITQDSSNLEINHWRISPSPFPGKERFQLLGSCMHQFGILMRETENLPKEIEYFKKAILIVGSMFQLNKRLFI